MDHQDSIRDLKTSFAFRESRDFTQGRGFVVVVGSYLVLEAVLQDDQLMPIEVIIDCTRLLPAAPTSAKQLHSKSHYFLENFLAVSFIPQILLETSCTAQHSYQALPSKP